MHLSWRYTHDLDTARHDSVIVDVVHRRTECSRSLIRNSTNKFIADPGLPSMERQLTNVATNSETETSY